MVWMKKKTKGDSFWTKSGKKSFRIWIAATMHCECALVAHVHQYTAFPAFSYVGVSELSFKHYYYRINAFNKITSTKFRARCTHDNWYRGWARPGFCEANIQAQVGTRPSISASSRLFRANCHRTNSCFPCILFETWLCTQVCANYFQHCS